MAASGRLAVAGSTRGYRGLAGPVTVSRRFRPVSAGLILAIPCLQDRTDPAMLRAQYASPAGAVAGVAGVLLAAAALGRVTWFYGSPAASARRRRAIHDDVLALIARPGPAADIRIIDSGHPAVYCLPGRRRIVLTTGALSCLDRC